MVGGPNVKTKRLNCMSLYLCSPGTESPQKQAAASASAITVATSPECQVATSSPSSKSRVRRASHRRSGSGSYGPVSGSMGSRTPLVDSETQTDNLCLFGKAELPTPNETATGSDHDNSNVVSNVRTPGSEASYELTNVPVNSTLTSPEDLNSNRRSAVTPAVLEDSPRRGDAVLEQASPARRKRAITDSDESPTRAVVPSGGLQRRNQRNTAKATAAHSVEVGMLSLYDSIFYQGPIRDRKSVV